MGRDCNGGVAKGMMGMEGVEGRVRSPGRRSDKIRYIHAIDPLPRLSMLCHMSLLPEVRMHNDPLPPAGSKHVSFENSISTPASFVSNGSTPLAYRWMKNHPHPRTL